MGKSAEIVFCRPKQVSVVTYFLLGVLMFAVSGFMAWGLAIGYPLRLHPVWVWIFFAASLLTGLVFSMQGFARLKQLVCFDDDTIRWRGSGFRSGHYKRSWSDLTQWETRSEALSVIGSRGQGFPINDILILTLRFEKQEIEIDSSWKNFEELLGHVEYHFQEKKHPLGQ